MPQVIFQQLSFGFSTPLFERLSTRFDAGWTGCIGANGTGKTTLLRLIAGDLVPTEGAVRVVPAGPIVWCRQQSQEQLPELRAFALDTSKGAQRWRGILGIDTAAAARFEQLSPGERKRWQLALALASEPSVLLLDEPTNHLDAVARELICSALRRFRGVGIVVSHDRSLLDVLTTRTARLRDRQLELCPGNYSQAAALWEERREATLHERAVLKQSRSAITRSVDRERRRALGAERDRSASRRMKDENDHDARGMLRKNQAEAAGRRLARGAAALETRLGRVQKELLSLRVEKQLGGELFAGYTPWPKPLVLRLELDELHAGGRRLLGRTQLDIGRTDKVTLVGPNGSGKTCLLRELQRQNERAFGASVCLPQTLSREALDRLRLELRESSVLDRGRVLAFVAALGSEPDAVLASPAWSPGEARKVALALGLCRHAPALVLDEPTNHFDLPSIERLERLLTAFPSAVVLVTHDVALAGRVGKRALTIEQGRVVERPPSVAGSTLMSPNGASARTGPVELL